MSKYHNCPECPEGDDITTIHDTLYICNGCGEHFNPVQIYA